MLKLLLFTIYSLMLNEEDAPEDNIVIENELDQEEIADLIPKMDLNLPEIAEPENLISDESLLGVYDEVLGNLRRVEVEVDGVLNPLIEMVIQQGDATSSSKEAMVNLLKSKIDIANSMSKVADLMTRVKLKETNSFPKYLAAHQNNTINISAKPKMNKRALLEKLNREKKESNE